jgi:indole-3-glycerol phosphate synthase
MNKNGNNADTKKSPSGFDMSSAERDLGVDNNNYALPHYPPFRGLGGNQAPPLGGGGCILDQINADKHIEVAAAKDAVPVAELMKYPAYNKPVPSLSEFLLNPEKSGIIAEHKRQSPSKGIINGKVTLEEVVKGYEEGGASAVSVLTDQKYFGGNLADLKEATSLLSIPVLRKDFIVDEYQIHEAKAYGAAIILLIAASLTAEEVDRFAKLARELGMEVLFEVHNEEELLKITDYVNVVGVNNRDLKTFHVDIQQSVKLAKLIPERFIKISESGISDTETVRMLKTHGYQGFLMGENFMKEAKPGEAFRNFVAQLKK